jgi:hypothetical protein
MFLFYFICLLGWSGKSPLLLRQFIGLLYQLWIGYDDDYYYYYYDFGAISGMDRWKGKQKYPV